MRSGHEEDECILRMAEPETQSIELQEGPLRSSSGFLHGLLAWLLRYEAPHLTQLPTENLPLSDQLTITTPSRKAPRKLHTMQRQVTLYPERTL